jgi:hypothetical protein
MARSSRARSNVARVAIGLACLAVGVARPSAHRLDEVLQAARIAIEPGLVQVEVSLTAGQLMADRLLQAIDADGDGTLSAAERLHYAQRVRDSLTLRVDDGPSLPLTTIEARFPTAEAMRTGDAAITILVAGALPPLAAGPHGLSFRNDHAPEGSVYLANALVPVIDRVAVTAQHRDVDQRELEIDFEVAPTSLLAPGWIRWPAGWRGARGAHRRGRSAARGRLSAFT